MKLELERPIAFIDLETTGINTMNDRIVEIAIVKLMPDGSRQKLEYRINPEMPIPADSSAIHGIYDVDVKDSPTFRDVSNEIRAFIEDSDLGGFNSNRFDIPMLNEEFLRVNHKINLKEKKMIDVQAIFHKMEQRNLTAAYKFYCGKDLKDAHSAMADTEATVDILLAQLDKYDSLSHDVNGLSAFSNDQTFLDYARRFVLINNVPVFNFGKHKGIPVNEVLKKEPQYYDWVMKSDFHRDTKEVLSELYTKFKSS